MKYFDRIGFYAGLGAAGVVFAGIYIGSRKMAHFDWALATYAVGSIFAAFAVAYRYAVWAQRPPTLMFLKRGVQLFLQNGTSLLKTEKPAVQPVAIVKNSATLGGALLDNFVLQRFIGKRSYERWIMHACLSWGGMLAFAITFPLVFGWVHSETLPTDAEIYRLFFFGFQVDQFNIHSLHGFIMFNLLNLSAVLVMIGLVLAVKLRMSDKAELAIQTFADDVVPIFILFLVTVTGMMLTVSAKFLAGHGFAFIGLAHAFSVIALLLYLPFGKLFHIFQRPASLGVSFYKKAGAKGPQAHCHRCGAEFASQMHVDDLKTVLDELGFDYRYVTPSGELHYQDICPLCRRRLLALNQGAMIGR